MDSTAPTVTLSDTDDDNSISSFRSITITAFFNEAMTGKPFRYLVLQYRIREWLKEVGV